jgi:hypothetical protein
LTTRLDGSRKECMYEEEIYHDDIGDIVVCDYCNADYTNNDRSGGVLCGGVLCPDCAIQTIRDYPDDIEAQCPPDLSFKEWVLRLRGGDNTITITSITTDSQQAEKGDHEMDIKTPRDFQ